MAETGTNVKWQQFRKSKMGLVFGMVLTALLSFVLLLYGGFLFCLPTILVAVIMYFIPRYFGLVGKKKLVVFGLVLMLFLGLASGYTVYLVVKDIQPSPVSSGDILTQGLVTPFRGGEAQSFNFTVDVKGASASSQVWVNLYDYFNTNDLRRINLTHSFSNGDGTLTFYQETQLPRSIYRHNFHFNQSATTEVVTNTGWGPFMITDTELLTQELYYNTLYVFLNVGLWFAFVIMATWWMDSSKKKMEAAQKLKKEAEVAKTQEKFVCSECGADVPVDAKECPQCGEKFEDEGGGPEKCPACGKEVAPGATSCWNCGKELKK
ncbi:MAG: zinc ribbon domain-containing protein [Methanomassiliicoccales archaeon]|nr:zinc ribbon domain-containing protein [Methanomassiliicoccales archaeon]MDD1756568.1 zinc ribbon domain-containing protein [Methanomassiliicoccales archaeon]